MSIRNRSWLLSRGRVARQFFFSLQKFERDANEFEIGVMFIPRVQGYCFL